MHGRIYFSPVSSPPVPNFNRLARPYRWLEYLTFGPFLWRCRTHYLPELAHCRRALVLGDGDGRFTARLLRVNPEIQITAIDASPRMIESLRQAAAPHRDRLTTHTADLRAWQPENSSQYDLIVTHFFLDCLTTEEIHRLAARISPATGPGALWLVSEFAIPGNLFGRAIAAPLVASLYLTFRVLTGLNLRSLPGYPRVLIGSGWSLQSHFPHLRGLLVSQLWRYHQNRC
jgi:SAM-dependent methyltransferase